MGYYVQIIAKNDDPDLCGSVDSEYLDSIHFSWVLMEVSKYVYHYIITPGTYIESIKIVKSDKYPFEKR